MAKHERFYLRRPHFETRRVDHPLEPVGDEEVAVLIDPAKVTRSEEALAVDRDKGRRRGFRSLPIAKEVLWAENHDFTLLSDRHFLQRLRIDYPGVGSHVGDSKALLLARAVGVEMRWRCSLCQPITLQVVQSIALQKALRDGLRHGRAAAADMHDRRQVVLIEIRTRQQVDHHGRYVGPMRYTAGGDQPSRKLAVPPRHDDQSRPYIDGAVHHADHPGHMKHRHHRQRHIVGRCCAQQRRRRHLVHDARVCVHAALGKPGGAAGVGQQRKVAWLGLVRELIDAAGQRLCPVDDCAAQ